MCPACIASMALTVAGVTSAGGLTALIAKKAGSKKNQDKSNRKGSSR